MPSETIWSSNHGSPNRSHLLLSLPQESLSYKLTLDVEPSVAKFMLDDPFGQLSLNDSSDIDDALLGLKKGSLLAITAPVAPLTAQYGLRLQFGTALILGGIALRHPPKDSFLQKFSLVADTTRDIELNGGLGPLSIDQGLRRPSFNETPINIKADLVLMSLPHGSLNENMNMPISRTLRHQLILEKIDNYNNNLPIQAKASLAEGPPQGEQKSQNFWNPATAPAFVPNNFQYGAPFNPYMAPNGAMSPPPPFMMAGGGFMDMYNFNAYPAENNEEAVVEDKESNKSDQTVTAPTPLQHPTPSKDHEKHQPGGVGLNHMRQQQFTPVSYMFHPFGPYGMYPPPPQLHKLPPPVAPENVSNHVKTANVGSPNTSNKAGGQNGKKRLGKRNQSSNKMGPTHIYRLPLLEEVRANPKKDYHLKDIYGHAVEFTKDQHGLRFIQQKLPEASEEEKEVIFNEIRDISYELMTDVFGNYVIQKYFEHGSKTHQQVLLELMLGHVYELLLQMYGCRVVQRALEAIELDGQIKIMNELRDYVLICAKDQNGNHVIQKLIERIPFEHTKFILDALSNQIYHLSTHPYGCRVIQRLLEYLDPADQQMILDELSRFIYYLIQDQYGNYVMQHIIERGDPKDRELILIVVLGLVVAFSKHKFALNVIEKCIKYGLFDQRNRILNEVMLGNEDFENESVADDSPLALMMKDQYANYVIQKLVEVFDAKSRQKRILVTKLRQYLKHISLKNSYGKHLALVEKMIIVAETALIDAENGN